MSSSDCVRMGHINVRSLLPKVNEIKNLILHRNLDILCLSETWLSEMVTYNSICIEGYNIIRKDRGSRGGGVAIYIKKNFTFSIIPTGGSIEQLWVSLQCHGCRFVVGALYRPPNNNDYKTFLSELEDSYAICSGYSDRIIFCGDLNIDFLKVDNSSTRYLLAFLESLDVFALINQPTRVAEGSITMIDQIFTNDLNLILNSGVLVCDISDHDLLYCDIAILRPKYTPIIRTFRDLGNINYDAFLYDLEMLSLHTIYRLNGVDEKVDFLTNNLLHLFDLHAPLITRRFSKRPAPWLTENVRLLMNLRDKAKTKYRSSHRPAHWEYYKQLRNLTNTTIKLEKKAYFEFLSRDRGSNSIFKHLQHLGLSRGKRVDIPDSLRDADRINDYFINSIPNGYVPPTTINSPPYCSSVFSFATVDIPVVASVIDGIKSTSTGQDGLGIQMIRMCCPYILPFLTNIINSCIIECKFPSKWKHASIIPLPKTSHPEELKDLRPISVLPAMSKILEKIMFSQISDFVHRNSLLPPVQSGFRTGHSCETALLKVTDDIITSTDRGLVTVLTLLDFTKAFDTVHHDGLVGTLRAAGFSAKFVRTCCWLSS